MTAPAWSHWSPEKLATFDLVDAAWQIEVYRAEYFEWRRKHREAEAARWEAVEAKNAARARECDREAGRALYKASECLVMIGGYTQWAQERERELVRLGHPQ